MAVLAALSAAVAEHPKSPIRIIIDTDMSTDCDDVGALCMAHALADLGECEILAVVHDTGALHGAPSCVARVRPRRPGRVALPNRY